MIPRRMALSLVITVALGTLATSVTSRQPDPELSTSVRDGFTIATVGDLIYAHDLGHMMADPGFAAVVDLLQTPMSPPEISKASSSMAAPFLVPA